jgi:two-component system, LuxR family, sensor kinase FixL
MARGLNPVRLVAQGLAAALKDLARSTEAAFGLRCECVNADTVAVANGSVAQHLYRIAQEALHNAVRHARAQAVRIELKNVRENLVLSVADDGVGFSASTAKRPGMGLHNMRARAELIGGVLEFRRGQRGGLVVTCTVHRPKDELPEPALTGSAG